MSVAAQWDSIENYLKAESIELDDLRWSGHILKVIVDAEGGVDVDRIAEIARGISRLLDDDPTLTDAFTLEVTSPGLERPLNRPSHYYKSIGREVAVTTDVPVEDETHHRGVLTAYDETTLTVMIGDSARSIPSHTVTAARTLFNWESSPKPGKKVS